MRILRLAIILPALLLINLPQSFAAYDSAQFNKTKAKLLITRITPTGKDVPAKRQIIFKFNQPVVPIGRMERKNAEIPISITPKIQCEWRWLNTSSLACQLSSKTRLKYATRYRIVIKPGLKTHTGKRMSQRRFHQFITQRPRVLYSSHRVWRSPVTPVLRIYFNQPVHQKSVRKNMYFRSGTKKIKIDVKPYYKNRKSPFASYWLVTPLKPLPPGATIKLMVRPGLISNQGPIAGVQNKVITTLHTFPAFRFSGLTCSNKSGTTITIRPPFKSQVQKCSPDFQVGLQFSSPFSIKTLSENMTMLPDSEQWETLRKRWLKGSYRYGFSPSRPHRKKQRYSLYLNDAIKANSPYAIKIQGSLIKDIFGRTLQNSVKLKFVTDHFNPRINLPPRVSILEQGVSPLLFIKTLNIDSIILSYSRFTAGKSQSSLTQLLTPEKNKNKLVATTMNLEKMLNANSGIVIGQVKTSPPLSIYKREFNYFSQVTPWHAHMKLGSFNSLLWITHLKTGLPLKDAHVEIIKGNLLKPSVNDAVLAEGTSDHHGLVTLPGLNTLDPTLKSYISYYYRSMMYAKITKGNSITILPFSQDFRNRYYSIANNGGSETIRRFPDYTKSWGFTAQGVHKPGDKIDFKIFVRDQDNLGFIPAPKAKYTLKILDPQGSKVYKKENLTLSKFGTFSDSLKTFKNSKSGWYRFHLSVSAAGKTINLFPMRVLVTDFTPAPFRVGSSLDSKLYKTGDTLKVTTKSELHAGGPYANGETRVTTMLLYKPLSPNTPKTRGFTFDTARFYRKTINQTIAKSNSKGIHHYSYKIANSPVVYGKLVTESAVKDERGKYVSTQSSAIFAGRDRYVGLKIKSWVLKQEKATDIYALVIDPKGALKSDSRFGLTIHFKETSIERKKNEDGILITKYKSKWVKVKEQHYISENKQNTLSFTPSKAGYYRFTVAVTDTKGRQHKSTLHRWASGKGRVYWKPKSGIKLNITAQKKYYRVGDKARFMIRNPYPGAKALITIERKGIITKWVKTFRHNIEILDIPVKPEYLPGFYVSVVVMAPRRADKNNKLSLAPDFRIGYSRVLVKDPYKELIVKVTPQKKIYKPRDTVKVKIHVQARHGKTPATELAIVVLDESVFDLLSQGKAYFDPYTGLYKLDGLSLTNFNLLQRLIAHKRKVKRPKRGLRRRMLSKKSGQLHPSASKADRPMAREMAIVSNLEEKNEGLGSSSPKVTVRNIFKYLGYWNGTIHPDLKGNASISFKAPDNLTGWRVLAIAVDKAQLMGLGQGTFKVNLPLELRPALPNQVTEGDSFTARFSVMNRTAKTRKVKLTIDASGNIKGNKKSKTITIIAPPFKRITAGIEVQATRFGSMTFIARANSGKLADATRLTLNIRRKKSMEVSANYGTSASDTVTETIKLPKNIRTDIGKLAVTVSTSILGHLQSAFTYLQRYPYSCWEQKLTKGVMASHYQQLKPWLPKSSTWRDSKKLPQQTLSMAASHQAPNGGMTYYVSKNTHTSPYLSAYTAIAFNWLRKHGHKIPLEVEKRLHAYLLKLIRGKGFPQYYNKGMSATVRAIALAALAEHGKVTRRDLLRYMPHVQSMSLFGKAHFLRALIFTKNTSTEQRKVMDIIQSRANETGGKYNYSERVNSGSQHLLYSSTRSQCAILSSMLAYETKEKNRSTDVPFKLLRAITAERKRAGRWNNTQDNMFCLSAMIDYSKVYEKQPPDMVLTLLANQKTLGSASLKGFREKPKVISTPMNKLGSVNKKFTVTLNRKGKGRYYFNTRLHYSLKNLRKNAVNAGIVIRREYSVERKGKWSLLKSPMKITRGELVRIDLYLDLAAARNFVVVDDPVPGGLEPVNKNLATASKVDARKAKMTYAKGSYWYRYRGWRGYGYSYWSFYHRELLHHSARFYSEYLPAGKYHLSYVAQAIAPGKFTVMPAHSEEMYNPDTYGKSKPGILIIEDDKQESAQAKSKEKTNSKSK